MLRDSFPVIRAFEHLQYVGSREHDFEISREFKLDSEVEISDVTTEGMDNCYDPGDDDLFILD